MKPPRDELLKLYQQPGNTSSSLAKLFNTSPQTMRSWIKSYDIPLKDHKTASTEANRRKIPQIPSRDELAESYRIHGVDVLEQRYGVGQQTIYMWLDYHQIERKAHSEACANAKRHAFDARISAWNLENDYEQSGYNQAQLRRQYGCSGTTLNKAFVYHGVDKQPCIRSQVEIDLLEFLQQIDPEGNWRANDRNVIQPLELDIVSDVRKLALECCGLYWHSEHQGGKDRNYHRLKVQRCNEAGYQLLTLFEDATASKMELIQSLLRLKVGKAVKRYYARQLEVRIVDNRTANEFERLHHLMGSVNCRVAYGLFDADRLVATMSFGGDRFKTSSQWEMYRFTNAKDCLIVGGASKLFKAFVRDQNPTNVVTYADLRYGNGNVYPNLGFKFSHTTQANYWYFKCGGPVELKSRVAFQKHKLADKLDNFDPALSEYQNMILNRYDRIWDCGNNAYIWQK